MKTGTIMQIHRTLLNNTLKNGHSGKCNIMFLTKKKVLMPAFGYGIQANGAFLRL